MWTAGCYFTGGLARRRSFSTVGVNVDDTSVGWAVGVGVDYAIRRPGCTSRISPHFARDFRSHWLDSRHLGRLDSTSSAGAELPLHAGVSHTDGQRRGMKGRRRAAFCFGGPRQPLDLGQPSSAACLTLS